MTRIAWALLFAAAAWGQIQVSGVSAMSTGAVIYATGEPAGCTIEVSDTASFAELATAVNDARGGRSACTGGERPSRGRSMQIVVGGPGVLTAPDGRKYSRALKPFTTYYYRLKQNGTPVAAGSFVTSNHPFGNLRTDPPQVDPNTPGDYAYPTIDQAATNWKTTDPSTGLQYTKLTKAGDLGGAITTGGFASVAGAGWTNPSAILEDDSSAATISGATAVLSLESSLDFGRPDSADRSSVDYVQLSLRGSGAAAAEIDRTVEIALSLDGATAITPWKDQVLTHSTATYTIGSATLGDLWQTPGSRPLSRQDLGTRTGTVDAAGTTVSWKSGDRFNVRWGAGSLITINSVEYTIASVNHDQQIILTTSAGTQTNAAYNATNFYVLIRKKTASADQISLQYASLTFRTSTELAWPAIGTQMCSPVVKTDGSGKEGTNCLINGGLYFVPTDGSGMRYLGDVIADDAGGEMNVAYTPSMFDPRDSDVMWGILPGWWPRGHLIRKGVYHGNHQASSNGRIPSCTETSNVQPCMEWTNLTPLSSGKDVEQMAKDYGGPPATFPFPPYCMTMLGGIQKTAQNTVAIGIYCLASQDTMAAAWILDMGNEVPVGAAGSTVRVVAYSDTFSRPARRWARAHSWELARNPQDSGWDALSNKPLSTDPNTLSGIGPYTLTATSVDGAPGANFTTTLTACPANTLHPELVGQMKCTTFIANRPAPCDDDPSESETSMIALNPSLHSTKCGGPGKYYLQDPAPGDFLGWVDLTYEVGELLKIDGTTFTLHRGDHYGYFPSPYYTKNPGAKNHTTKVLTMMPSTVDYTTPVQAEMHHWNWVNDAYHASAPSDTTHNLRGDFENGHTGTGGDTLIASADTCSPAYTYYNLCYQARVGNIAHRSQGPGVDAVMTLNPHPGGNPLLGYPNTIDSHGIVFPGGNFMLDGRPFNGADTLPRQTGVLVSGQLSRFTSAAFGAEVQTLLKRKLFDTIAFAGVNPLQDISSAATGDVIGTGSSDSYKYCVSERANECRAGSAVGDVYVNAPQVRIRGCLFPGIAVNAADIRNICVLNNFPLAHRYTQSLVRNDYEGRYVRSLGSGLQLYSRYDPFMNMSYTPNGKYAFFRTQAAGWTRSDVFSMEIPPVETDSVNRTEFVPVSITMAPVAGADSAVVEFGYARYASRGADANGAPDEYLFCTSRREKCVMAAGTTSANPYFFAGESYSGISCGSGCEARIPAVPGRVLYYRVLHRAGARLIAADPLRAVPVP